MQRQQVENVVRVQETKAGRKPAAADVQRRPLPLDAEALKQVVGGKSASIDTPHKGW